jgi:hypothetical protein
VTTVKLPCHINTYEISVMKLTRKAVFRLFFVLPVK